MHRWPAGRLQGKRFDPVLPAGNPLNQHLNKERPMIGVGDLYLGSPELHFTDDRIINLVRAHDLLFYYNQTRPLL
jgi:hypothetical protein